MIETAQAADGQPVPRALVLPVLSPQGWSLAALLVIGLALFWQSWAGMAAIWWRSETFAHGALVVPIVAWLIWRHRKALLQLEWRSQFVGLPLVVAVTIVWVAGRVAQAQVVEQLAAAAMVPALVISVAGSRVTREITFALCFLFFAVPFGEALIPALMKFTASFAAAALRLSGIAVFRDGMLLSTAIGDFQVEKACSGIRYLIASLAVGSLFAHLIYHSTRRRLAFIVLSIIVPVIGNGLRAYLIILIAHLSDMQAAVGIDHLIYGWLFFGVLMGAMFWIGLRFSDAPPPTPAAAELSLASPRASKAAWRAWLRRDLWIVILALTIMILGPLWATTALRASSRDLAEPQLMAARDGWSGPSTVILPWRQGFPPQAIERTGEYRSSSGGSVLVSLHFIGEEMPGAELINSNVYPVLAGPTTRISDRGAVFVAPDLPVFAELEVVTASGRWLVWHAYMVGERFVSGQYGAKLQEAQLRLRGLSAPVVVVTLAARYDHSGRPAESVMRDFVASNLRILQGCMSRPSERAGDCAEMSATPP